MKEQIRKIAIDNLNGLTITPADRIFSKKFLSYLEAYCCELNMTDFEALLIDDNFEKIFDLYSNIIAI